MNRTFRETELSSIATLWDCLHKTPSYSDDGYPMVRVTDVTRGFLNLSGTLRVDNKTYNEFIKRHKPSIGDILFTRVGSYGNSCYVDREEDFCLGQNTVCITPDRQKIAPYFLYCCLNASPVKKQIDSFVGGASQPTISLKNISLLKIPLPDIALQQKIAAVLSAYDDLIENNLRRIKILEEMAQNLYREWFVKFRFPRHEKARFIDSPLGRIPEGWEVKRLDEVALFQNNGTEAGEHLRERIYLPIDCIPRKSLAITETNSWTEAQSSLHLFEEGDILFGAMRPYFHKVVVAPFKGVTRKTCFAFKSALPEYHAFTALLLFQESTVSFANAHSKGATIPYAVWPQAMDGMPVVVPPIEQAKRFEDVVGPMITRIGTMFFQNSTLRRTRDLLLPKLISGEVDVSELDINIAEEAV